MSTRDIGQSFEAMARARLEREGLSFVAANVNYAFGELDLVMREGETLVFVEVRYRRNTGFGGGLQSVTRSKQRRIANAAGAWLASHPIDARRPCRFDVIAIAGDMASPQVQWERNAFSLDDLG